MPVDDSYTKALLHFDGANGSTTITDESGKTWTAGSGAALSTAQIKFGTSSASFSGAVATASIVSETSSDFDLSSINWTVDFWAYPTFFSGGNNVVFYIGANSGNKIVLATIGGAGSLYYLINGGVAFGTATSPNINAWNHIALVNDAGTTKLYLNGTAVVGGTTATMPSAGSKKVDLGSDAGGAMYSGYMDEFRVSIGIARWTTDFIPPTAPYAPAAADSVIYGATLLTEILPASAGKISSAMLLVEITDMPNPFGIIPTTLASRSTAATMRTKRKTYATLNERSTTLTLEERT